MRVISHWTQTQHTTHLSLSEGNRKVTRVEQQQ
ncbi:hypothetical protein P4O66_003723, partial [Electrophorus voltai]